MAAKASNLTVPQLLHANLIDKLKLKSTGWLVGQNPIIAAGMCVRVGCTVCRRCHSQCEGWDLIIAAGMCVRACVREWVCMCESGWR